MMFCEDLFVERVEGLTEIFPLSNCKSRISFQHVFT